MEQLNIGIRAHDMEAGNFHEVASRIKQRGFQHTQLAPLKQFAEFFSKGNAITPGFASQIGKILRHNDLDICVLGSYVNIVHLDQETREQELDKYYHMLRLAKSFGAQLVGTETGSVGKGFTEENYTDFAFERMIDSVEHMVREAEKWGVTVGIEPGVNHPLHSIEKTEKMLSRINSHHLQLILDPVNLLMPETEHLRTEITNKAFQVLGDRVAVIHLKDYVVENNQIKFVALGQGRMDISPILKFVKYVRPGIHISLESTLEKDLDKSLEYLYQEFERV